MTTPGRKSAAFAALAAAALGLTVAPTAHAISYSAALNGASVPAGVAFAPLGGPLSLTTVDTFRVLGVGFSELGASRQLDLTFAHAVTFASFTVGLLYQAGQFPMDVGNEVAIVTLNDSPSFRFTLQVTGATTALWGGSGVVSNLSAAVRGRAAVWRVDHPFADVPVSKVTFRAPADGSSDFGLVAFRTSGSAVANTPDSGATILLLCGGLAAILTLRRFIPPSRRLC